MRPTVSVIVPNYNHSIYLNKRLNSIFDQTYQDFEVILLDDCSTDNSVEIIKQYANHPKVTHVMINEVNSGSTFKQWKKGIDLAQGKYVWIAESDDWAGNNFLTKLVPKLETYPNIGLVYCESWVVDELGNEKQHVSEWIAALDQKRWHADFINSGVNECSEYLITQNLIFNASSVLFKKELFENVFEEAPLKLTGDWLLWAKMLLQSDLYFVAEPLNYFRFHDKSVRSNPAIRLNELKEISFVVEYLRKKIDVEQYKVELAYRIVVDRLYSNFGRKILSGREIAKLFGDNHNIPKELQSAINNKLNAGKKTLKSIIRRLLQCGE